MNEREFENRIESEAMSTSRVTNNDLVCRTCKKKFDDSYIFGNTSKCEYFRERKPNEVLLGGDCIGYENEE